MIKYRNQVIHTKEAADIYKTGTYLEKNETWHVEDPPWKAKQIQRILQSNNINPRTLCEVGCGAGEILKQLADAMPCTNFIGYEISPQAFSLCKTRESEKVEYRFKDVLSEDEYFDCLLCIDVFEHVEDYMGFVKSLKSKSCFKIFHIPLDVSVMTVFRGLMMKQREKYGHLHYFTPETALATLADCGYEIVDYFYTTGFNNSSGRTLKTKAGKLPRKILYALSPDLMVKLIGGCSLLVLTK